MNLDDIAIRPYTEKDFENVKINLQQGDIFDPNVDSSWQWKKLTDYDPQAILVAEHEGAAIGNIFTVFSPWYSSIRHLAVRKDYQKIGVGRRLLREAEQIIVDRGGKWASVDVTDPELKRYYGRHGYKQSDVPVLHLHKVL